MLTLPIYWTDTKKSSSTTHLVGMNFYRNCHFHIKAKIKRDFHELVLNQSFSLIKIPAQFKVHYDLFYKSPVCDGSNIISLIEKFFLDALQEAGVITNDNVNFHVGSSWSIHSQDKLNPRVEITLIPIP